MLRGQSPVSGAALAGAGDDEPRHSCRLRLSSLRCSSLNTRNCGSQPLCVRAGAYPEPCHLKPINLINTFVKLSKKRKKNIYIYIVCEEEICVCSNYICGGKEPCWTSLPNPIAPLSIPNNFFHWRMGPWTHPQFSASYFVYRWANPPIGITCTKCYIL